MDELSRIVREHLVARCDSCHSRGDRCEDGALHARGATATTGGVAPGGQAAGAADGALELRESVDELSRIVKEHLVAQDRDMAELRSLVQKLIECEHTGASE